MPQTAQPDVQQITAGDLAVRLKQKFPELSRYSDDSVVESFLDKNPQYRQYVKYDLNIPKDISIQPPAPWWKRAGATLGRAMPGVAGTVGAVAGTSGSPMGTIGGAALGGAAGEALQQIIDRAIGMKGQPQTSGQAAKDIAIEGGLQGGMQAVSEGVGRAVPWSSFFPAGRVAGKEVAPQEILEMSRTPGIRMTAGEIRGAPTGVLRSVSELGMLSEKASEKYATQTARSSEKMASEFLDSLAPPATKEQSGIWVKDALNKSSQFFKQEGQRLFAPFRGQAGQAIPTNFDSLVDLANKIEKERTPMVLGAKATSPLPVQSPAQQLLDVVKNPKGSPQNFDTAMQLRDYLQRFLPGSDHTFADKESETIAKRFSGELSRQLDADAAKAGAGPAWKEARDFWRTGRQRFNSQVIRGIIKKNPEAVADSIKPGDVTNVRTLKDTLFDYANTIPDPKDRAIAQQEAQRAWSSVQRSFAERRMIADPTEKSFTLNDLKNLKARMDKIGPSQLKEMYGDPNGQQFIHNMRTFAELMNRMDLQTGMRIGRFRVLYDIVGTLGSLGAGVYSKSPGEAALTFAGIEGAPRLLSVILHNKQASDLFLRSILSPPSSKALAASVAQRIVQYTVKELQSDDQFNEVNDGTQKTR